MTADPKNHLWWQRAHFYSLYIDQFAGDIPGLIHRLDYFTHLGIDCLHLLPHYPSPLQDDGFDITDHTGVRPALGTVADFKALCEAAHRRGLRIMVDLVLNHVSVEHEWFQSARANKDSPYRDWFLWSDTGTEYSDAAVIFADFKDSNWIYNEPTNDYYYAVFKPSQPDLNWQNPAVQAAMFEVIDTLVGYGVDGFRLDAIMNLVEQEGTDSVGTTATHDCIRAIRQHLDTHHPGTILLGEVVGTTEYSRQYFGNGHECHLSYNFELMNEMLFALCCGGFQDQLRVAMEAARALPPNAGWMSFLRNHDSVTLSTLEPARQQALLDVVDPERTYMFSRGTETVQRLYNLLGCDDERYRAAVSMLYSLPTATVMYYGDELGQRNAPVPAGTDDMRSVVRGPFDWQEAEQQMTDPTSMFHHVKKCIAKRNK